MKKKFKFTTSLLKSIPANPPDAKGTELEFSDSEINGCKCLSGKSGSKRFFLRYSFQDRKASISIGRFPDIDLATARKIARQYKSQIATGIDPKTERDEITNKPLTPPVKEFFYDPPNEETQTYLE